MNRRRDMERIEKRRMIFKIKYELNECKENYRLNDCREKLTTSGTNLLEMIEQFFNRER